MDQKEINFEEMQKIIAEEKGIVVFELFSPSCKACFALDSQINKVKNSLNKFKIYSINVQEYSEVISDYELIGVPTILIFKDGHLKDTIIGCNVNKFLIAIKKLANDEEIKQIE